MEKQAPSPIEAKPLTISPSPGIKRGTANDDVAQRSVSPDTLSPQRQESPPNGSGSGIGTGVGPARGGGPLDNPPVSRDPNKIDYNRIYSGKEVDRRARVLEKPEPIYTAAARQHNITGTIVLRAVLTAQGQVTDIKALSTLPDGLTERAIEAARRIRFEPALINGRPVSMYIQLEYNFNLY
jgi:TonB family protein